MKQRIWPGGVDTAARLEAAIKVLGGMPPAPPRDSLYALGQRDRRAAPGPRWYPPEAPASAPGQAPRRPPGRRPSPAVGRGQPQVFPCRLKHLLIPAFRNPGKAGASCSTVWDGAASPVSRCRAIAPSNSLRLLCRRSVAVAPDPGAVHGKASPGPGCGRQVLPGEGRQLAAERVTIKAVLRFPSIGGLWPCLAQGPL